MKEIKILPDVFYCLYAIIDREFSDQHPLSILNLSFSKVIKEFEIVLDSVLRCKENKKMDDQILIDYKNLLSSLSAFWKDDTKAILKLFPGVKFKIGDYATLSDTIINKIKHDQRQILPRVLYLNDQIIPGFSIAKISQGVVTLCDIVHKKKNKVGNAISFYYELRRIFLSIYLHGKALNEAIMFSDKSIGELDHIKDDQCNKVKNIIDKLNKLPDWYFPSEFDNLLPNIDDFEVLNKLYCSNDSQKFYLVNIKEEQGFVGDGVTRSFSFKKIITEKGLDTYKSRILSN